MQTQAQVHASQQSIYHNHPPPPQSNGIQTNGIHSEGRSQQSAGHANGQDMYPYGQPPGQYPGQPPEQYSNQPAHYQHSHHQYRQQQHQFPPVQQSQQQPQQYYGGQQQQQPLPRMQPPPGQSGLQQLPPMQGMAAPTQLPQLPMPPVGSLPPPQPPMYAQTPMQMRQPQPGPAVKAEGQPLSMSGTDSKYKYTLVVQQQPKRARMCGFGDKDRRPITPPPCIRLLIQDRSTGKEVDIADIDGSFYILQVDLWDKEATREVNIVRASTSSPAVSISTATTTSYPPTPERTFMQDNTGLPVYIHHGPDGQAYQAYAHPGYSQMQPQLQYTPQHSGQSTAQFTRNLIGSLTVNASRLRDEHKKEGFWFVLQDLSVRTEGFFRLKMNFISVGRPDGAPGLNQGTCPVLASVYSNEFQVFSAKKFPGVIESTPLSKTFASQGIKIPIRKEGKPERDELSDD